MKVGLSINFKREIVHYSGIHLGTENDGQIGLETIDHGPGGPREPWEHWIGDGPYEVFALARPPTQTFTGHPAPLSSIFHSMPLKPGRSGRAEDAGWIP